MLPLVAVVGATGTGKSQLAVSVAKRLDAQGGAEVINADALQLYRHMDIGTAKLRLDEREGIVHHMLDVLDPLHEANVAAYQRKTRALIDDIRGRGRIPVLVGGSGLYVSSIVQDFRFPGTDAAVRSRWEQALVSGGPGALHGRLRELDRDAATAIGPHNGRRLVRALEVIELTGRPFGSGLPKPADLGYPTVIMGVHAPRPELVERLERRVVAMWADGLVEEVRSLRDHGLGVTAVRAIGYAQALAQLEGVIGQQEAMDETSSLTRRYARRQVSWFRRLSDIRWLDYDDPQLVRIAAELVMREN